MDNELNDNAVNTKCTFFDKPTQLEYWDSDRVGYVGGIGYRDIIIEGISGNIINPEEVYARAEEYTWITPIITYSDWLNIDEAIRN